MAQPKKLRVGISCGDINGIGLEVVLKSVSDSRIYEQCIPVVYASKQVVEETLKITELPDVELHHANGIDTVEQDKLNVINSWSHEVKLEFGKSTTTGGQCAFASLKSATEDLASGKIDVLVTAPINKKNIQSEKFDFPGHTEFLADYANEDNPLMILAHEGLRVALVSGHIPLKEVSSNLSQELILTKIEVFNRALIQDFGIVKPRIAVLALNPHGGDEGLLGDEEIKIISPAISEAREKNLLAFGPFPADGLFGSHHRSNYDGILAMYHDQGLAPFKSIAFEDGVNFTAGLPVVRTSPDHGVAYDIAGENMASERSFRQAIFAAVDIYQSRERHKEMTSNVLEKHTTKRKEV